MKKFLSISLLILLLTSCRDIYKTQQPVRDTIYWPAHMRYNVPNTDRVFGEALYYHALQFTDDEGALRTVLFTDSSLKVHIERAIKKGY